MPENESKPQSAADKPRLEKVTLKKGIKHRGEEKQPGDQIEVTPDQKKRLQRHDEI